MSSIPVLRPLGETAPARLVRPVYVAAIGLSAFLLFSVQPLFARMVLPILGGSPAVWSVTTVVFQCLLLAGYAYAHAIAACRTRTVVLIHLAVLAVAAFALPIGLMPGWHQPPAGFEALWLAAFVLVSVGLPFFAVSANGPLLQALFARTGHRDAADPYFLYAASNIGSFAALASYPLLIEPLLRLRDQADVWAIGFGLLTLLIGAAACLTLRPAAAMPVTTVVAKAAPVSWRQRLVWVALAAVPSGLLVAVTAHITTDIAPIPLLWVLPLGLYLLTFVIAFRPNRWLDLPYLTLLRIGLTLIGLVGVSKIVSFELSLAIHLVLFTLTSLVCHGMLYRLRPDPSRLTGFYLALSVGGALGGLFCGLVAPLVFDTLAEYPLFLVAALACRPDVATDVARLRGDAGRALVLCACVVAAALVAIWFGAPPDVVLKGATGAIAILAILRWRSTGTTVVALATITLMSSVPAFKGEAEVESIRSFFGIHGVKLSPDGRFRVLLHGTTLHGAVRVREEDGSPRKGRPEPTTYYGYDRVIGTAIASARGARGGRLGAASIVGLGSGSLACHRQAGESWSFYEIDAAVVRIARDPARFPFLAECGPDIPVVVGDARLTLASAPRGQDLILIDAFSSDAIPTHLLTREAIGLYLSRLAPHGVIVMHVSNRHLDLTRILARAAAEHGLVTLMGVDGPDKDIVKTLRAAAKVVVLARSPKDFGAIGENPAWRRIEPEAARRPWTDDFSNVLEALWDGRKPVE